MFYHNRASGDTLVIEDRVTCGNCQETFPMIITFKFINQGWKLRPQTVLDAKVGTIGSEAAGTCPHCGFSSVAEIKVPAPETVRFNMRGTVFAKPVTYKATYLPRKVVVLD